MDLHHRAEGPRPTTISFDILLEGARRKRFVWQFDWGLKTQKTLRESMWSIEEGGARKIFQFSKAGLTIGSSTEVMAKLRISGSILDVVNMDDLGTDNLAAQTILEWGRGITSLELLSPSAIRGSVRAFSTDIGLRGERLAGFLAGLESAQKAEVVRRLAKYYPIGNIETIRKRAGWIDMRIREARSGITLSVDHVSDGLLRLMALAAIPELGDDASLVLLDEVEDGLEPHILPKIIADITRESAAQIIMTSHSPILLNFVDAESAALVTRDDRGRSKVTRASDLRTFSSGEDLFAPGELWLNTSLPTLQRQAERVAIPDLDGVNYRERIRLLASQ